MNRIFLALLVVCTVLSSSCKKDKSTICYASIKDITGFYRITKVIIGGADVTSTYMTPCRQSANLQLYSDKTAIYEETDPTCTGTSGGTWDIDLATNKVTVATGGNIITITDATITGWDCATLVVSGNYSGSDYQVTLTRYQIP